MRFIFLLFFVCQPRVLFSQRHFIISGTTNLVLNGKIILSQNAPAGYYATKFKSDTVEIINHQFVVEGSIRYPEQFRITIIDGDEKYPTEPFFLDSGVQKVLIDSGRVANDFLDFGYGISMQESKANDEYTKKYLPLLNDVNKKIDALFSEISRCDTISDSQTKTKCIIQSENQRIALRRSRDSILYSYAALNPNSPIILWLLYGSLLKYGYNEYYQKTLTKISTHTLPNLNKQLEALLYKQKTKAVGSSFPLLNFINSKASKNYIQNNKYTLVDFWYGRCSPCIRQFNSLRGVYEKNKNKGFNIVAISVDRKENIDYYKKVLSQNNYPWKQLLDTAGFRADLINIDKYPTNFLLNSDGKIVYVDINYVVLEAFLKQQL